MLMRSQRPRPRRRSTARPLTAALFLLPALVLYITFVIAPLLTVISYSFFDWRGVARGAFIGLGNFQILLGPGPIGGEIMNAFKNNWYFFVGTMVVQNTLGLTAAVLLNDRKRGRRFFQTIIAVPFLVNPLVVGYVWLLLLNPTFGPFASLLRGVGLDSWVRPWLGAPGWAQPAVILINAWQWVGFPMLFFGAALAAIPEDLTSAAKLDGATSWQRLSHITLPLLAPAIGTLTVLTFIGCFNAFNLQYAVGGVNGGPAGSNDVLGLVFYRLAFGGNLNSIGQSSALAAVMFVFVLLVAVLLRRVLNRVEERYA